MSSAVDIGTLQGTIAFKNAYSAEFAKFDREVKEKLIGSTKNFSQLTQKESDKIKQSYDRIAASLDPVVANTQKYQRAEQSLTAALKAGIITQDQYNRSLSQAKEKYLGVNSSTSTWRDEVQKLTNTIIPFNSTLGNLIGSVEGIKVALLGSSAATSAAAGSAGVATSSFRALSTALLPILPILAAFAAVAGTVALAFKSFSFLSDVTSKGLETQLVIERLNTTLQATGAYAQMSSAQLVALAESYELLSGRQKEEIIGAEIILARFESLNQQVFPEALRITLAYAKAMGVTADQASTKLGPALEGNTRSLGALKEAGIILSASQRKTLQDMIETGNIAEYQALLFAILREKVGELSTEYDKNLSRQVERSKIIMDDFGEAIANQVIPALEDLVQEIVESLGGWDNLKKVVNEVGKEVGQFIRFAVYGLIIEFHKLMGSIDSLAATFNQAFASIADP